MLSWAGDGHFWCYLLNDFHLFIWSCVLLWIWAAYPSEYELRTHFDLKLSFSLTWSFIPPWLEAAYPSNQKLRVTLLRSCVLVWLKLNTPQFRNCVTF
jgi:hypothetical protein